MAVTVGFIAGAPVEVLDRIGGIVPTAVAAGARGRRRVRKPFSGTTRLSASFTQRLRKMGPGGNILPIGNTFLLRMQRTTPQLSSDELLANADLAGFARVLAMKVTPMGRVARLRFEQILKGKFQGSFADRNWSRLSGVVTVKLRKAQRTLDGTPIQGEWSDRLDPGDRIMVHLRWDSATGSYSTIASNAIWLAPG